MYVTVVHRHTFHRARARARAPFDCPYMCEIKKESTHTHYRKHRSMWVPLVRLSAPSSHWALAPSAFLYARHTCGRERWSTSASLHSETAQKLLGFTTAARGMGGASSAAQPCARERGRERGAGDEAYYRMCAMNAHDWNAAWGFFAALWRRGGENGSFLLPVKIERCRAFPHLWLFGKGAPGASPTHPVCNYRLLNKEK